MIVSHMQAQRCGNTLQSVDLLEWQGRRLPLNSHMLERTPNSGITSQRAEYNRITATQELLSHICFLGLPSYRYMYILKLSHSIAHRSHIAICYTDGSQKQNWRFKLSNSEHGSTGRILAQRAEQT